MLTPVSHGPQQICLNWIQFQAIGRHPLTNCFRATQLLGGRIISMLWLSRHTAVNRLHDAMFAGNSSKVCRV